MIKLHKIFIIAGMIYVIIGFVLELVYFFYLKDLVWILLIYPPPGIYNFVKVVPYLGGLFILMGGLCLIIGIYFYLKEDLEKLRTHKFNSNMGLLFKL